MINSENSTQFQSPKILQKGPQCWLCILLLYHKMLKLLKYQSWQGVNVEKVGRCTKLWGSAHDNTCQK